MEKEIIELLKTLGEGTQTVVIYYFVLKFITSLITAVVVFSCIYLVIKVISKAIFKATFYAEIRSLMNYHKHNECWGFKTIEEIQILKDLSRGIELRKKEMK